MSKEPNEIVYVYRRVFSSIEGRIVLDDICLRGKLLSRCETQEDIGRENLVKEIILLTYGDEEGFVQSHKWTDLLKRLAKRKK